MERDDVNFNFLGDSMSFVPYELSEKIKEDKYVG